MTSSKVTVLIQGSIQIGMELFGFEPNDLRTDTQLADVLLKKCLVFIMSCYVYIVHTL
jgi:hypothetical protein